MSKITITNGALWAAKELLEHSWKATALPMVVGLVVDRKGNAEWLRNIGKIRKVVPFCIASAVSTMLVRENSPATILLMGSSPMLVLLVNAVLRKANKFDKKMSEETDAIFTRAGIALGISMAALGMVTRRKVVSDWFWKTFPHPSAQPFDH